MQVIASGREAAIDAVRRSLLELAASDAPTVPVAAVRAVSASGASPESALQARLAGRSVPALVLERLGADSGIVEVAGERLRVQANLPVAGTQVLLRFSAGVPTAAATPTPAEPRISLGNLAQAMAEVHRNPPAPLIVGATPARVDRPAEFARALAEQVGESGLFYESHVARWSADDYPLARLQREPQAAEPAPARAGHAEPAALASLHDAPSGTAPLASGTSQPIVREQLALLENRAITFQFEPWPGQHAQWQIGDDRDHHAATGAAPDEACWSSRLALDLPNLGSVTITLGLRGRQLQVTCEASRHTEAGMLGEVAALRSALAAAGIGLTQFGIRHGGTG